jgi:phage gp46-like protein
MSELSGEIKIIDTDGVYDFDFDDDSGDFVQDDGLETAILMSLFCNERATEEQVPQPFKRGGYWAIDITGMQFSHLWLVNGRKTQDKLNLGSEYCNTALNWLIEKGYATEVNTEASFTDEGIQLDIAISKPNGITDNYTYQLWLNTDF